MLRLLDLGHLAEVRVEVVQGTVERGRAKDPGMVQVVLVQEKVDAVVLHSTHRWCSRNPSCS